MNPSRLVLLHRRLSHLTVSIAMLTLVLSEASLLQPVGIPQISVVPLTYLAIVLMGSIMGWFLAERPGRVRVSNRMALALVAVVVAFVLLEGAATGSYDLVLSLSHFLILVQLIKVFGAKRRRDYSQMYLISLVHICVAAVVTSDFVFVVGLFAYTATMTWTLVVFHFRGHLEPLGVQDEHPEPVARLLTEVLTRRFAGVLLLILVLAWIGNVFFFIFSPRFRTPLYGLAQNQIANVMLSGFSSNVRLGEMGSILEDATPVLHVKLSHEGDPYRPPDEAELEWRGVTLQHYDGQTWEQSGEELNTRFRSRFGGLPINDVSARKDDFVVDQEIMLQPTGQRALFALPKAFSMKSDRLDWVEHRWIDNTFHVRRPPGQTLTYEVSSIVSGPSAGLQQEFKDCPARTAYLQIPDVVTNRVRDLARTVTTGVGFETDLAKARAVEQYLQGEFTYTLEQQRDPTIEPIEYFLFNRKAGHCEYFASAMVVMLRAVDVPARVVTGFKGAEWNDIGHWYVVRQSDAHAWVEAWIGGQGWVAFDPTPAAAREMARRARTFSWFSRWRDYLYNQWLHNVYQYDREQQSEVYSRTGDFTRHLHRGLAAASVGLGQTGRRLHKLLFDPDFLNSAYGIVTLVGVFLVSAVLGIVLYLGGRGVARRMVESRRRRRRHAAVSSAAFYAEMLRTLERRGLKRAPETTPREFAHQAADLLGPPSAQPLTTITENFCRLRYGRRTPSDQDRQTLRDALDRLSEISRARARQRNRS